MRRLALPVFGLLACTLLLVTDAQGLPFSYETASVAPSAQHVQKTHPSASKHRVPYSSTRCAGETDESLSGDSNKGAAPVTHASVRATVRATDAAGTSIYQQAAPPVLPLYHLYRVLLI